MLIHRILLPWAPTIRVIFKPLGFWSQQGLGASRVRSGLVCQVGSFAVAQGSFSAGQATSGITLLYRVKRL